MNTITEKSEILFLYETKYSMPNGDPFTGEQRYDEESKCILISDVRIKRFIRDYFMQVNDANNNDKYEVYVIDTEKLPQGVKESGSAIRLNFLANKPKYKAKYGDVANAKKNNKQEQKALELLKECIDVRLFGGISTKEGAAVNLTGPVQFALLNPSLNHIDLRLHQNTSVFASSEEKSRGAIGTTSLVPYSLCQIHGWINPFSARFSGLTQNDINEMFAALWHSINNANTRTKSNQSSVLLLQIVYTNITDKLYEIDKLVKISINKEEADKTTEKRDEQIRDRSDFKINIDELIKAADSDKVGAINYYTEDQEIKKLIPKNNKFKEMALVLLT